MKKTRNIPAIVTLLGCLVAVIVTYLDGYKLNEMLKVLLIVIFIFLFLGLIIKHVFEKYIPPVEDEGSVIEKGSDSDEDETVSVSETTASNEAGNEEIQ